MKREQTDRLNELRHELGSGVADLIRSHDLLRVTVVRLMANVSAATSLEEAQSSLDPIRRMLELNGRGPFEDGEIDEAIEGRKQERIRMREMAARRDRILYSMPSTVRVTVKMKQSGMLVPQIAEERELSRATITRHLNQFTQALYKDE